MINFQFSIFKSQKKSAFTFIEVLLVVTIIMVLSLSSAVFYSRFVLQNAVSNTADQLVGSLRKAQIYSMTGKQGGVWGVRYAPNTITLYLAGNSDFDEIYRVNPAVSVSGFTETTFAKATGLPSSTGTITVSGNDNIKTITINAQGVVDR